MGVTPEQENYKSLLHEDDPNFTVLPTMGLTIPLYDLELDNIPGLILDITKAAMQESYVELFKPLSPQGRMTTKYNVLDYVDKKIGATLYINTTTYDESLEKVCHCQIGVFFAEHGGFGGPRIAKGVVPSGDVPKGLPDAEVTEQLTSFANSLYYLVVKDPNPVHADKAFCRKLGLPGIPLTGPNTTGFAVRAVVKSFAGNDYTKVKAVKTMYSKRIMNNDTLTIKMWKRGNRVFFRTFCKGKLTMDNSYVDLFD